jgi:Holliday junction resolvase
MSKFQTKTINKLKAKGWKVIKLIRLSESGYPDLLALKNGVTIFVECKEVKDTLKPLQAYRIEELKKLGFDAFVEQDGKESELDKYLNK